MYPIRCNQEMHYGKSKEVVTTYPGNCPLQKASVVGSNVLIDFINLVPKVARSQKKQTWDKEMFVGTPMLRDSLKFYLILKVNISIFPPTCRLETQVNRCVGK